MKSYELNGKRWVLQTDLVAELGVGRYPVETATRRKAFKRNVCVLVGVDRRSFLKRHRLERSSAKVALIEREAAEKLLKQLQRPKPEQQKLPFPPIRSGHDRLRLLTRTFRNESVSFLEFDGRRCLPAIVLGRMLGYEPPSVLTRLIRVEWATDFPNNGVEYVMLTGDMLDLFKDGAKQASATNLVHARASQLLVLFESGVNKVLLKTQRPDGFEVRDFLAKEVMPTLSRLVQPKNFFLNEQHERLNPKTGPALDFLPRPAASGMVNGGLSDHGAERLHQAITLNTSYALADKLVHAGRLTGETAITVQVALVKEFGGVDIMARAQACEAPKMQVAVTPKPEALPTPKRERLTKTIVAEEPWTLATTDEETYALGHAAQELRKETGRPVTAEIIKMLAGKLGIHIHYDTKPRSRTSAGVPYIRVSDYFKVRRYLAENPTVLPQQLS